MTAGRNVVFAVTEDHDVYMWGEKGLSPTGGRDAEEAAAASAAAEGLSEVNEADIKPSSQTTAPHNAESSHFLMMLQQSLHYMQPQLITSLEGEEVRLN